MATSVVRQEDIVLVTNACFAGLPHDRIPPPHFVSLPLDLGRDVYLDKLPDRLAERVMSACEPAGENFRPVRQFGQLYTFIRRNPPADAWDCDMRLQQFVAISRLVKPTSVGFEYSARLEFDNRDEVLSIAPGAVTGFGAQAWIVSESQDDWFEQSEIVSLKRLWGQTTFPLVPERIGSAFWYHEYAARTMFAAVRWVLVCTGVESLINTRADRVSRQFATRMPELARRFCGREISRSKASRMYELRCKVAHGAVLGALDPASRDLYSELETTLRTTLLGALSDPKVAELFASEDGIDQEWPLL